MSSHFNNPFAPGDFAGKHVLKLVELFSGALKNKAVNMTCAGCIPRGLLFQMQNISLPSSGMCRKQNFDTAVLSFTFHFLSSPLFLLFLPIFFLFGGIYNVEGFILLGKVFRKPLGS